MLGSAENSKCTAHECQVTSFEALTAAMRHEALTSDPVTVCSLLQTCKSWRSALQQSAARNTVIITSNFGGLQSINKFALLASWIPKHAALISEIHLDSWRGRDNLTAMAELLAFAMQHAASQLHLTALSTNILGNATPLQQLSPASLTQLTIDKDCGTEYAKSINSTAVATAIGRLTALRQLSISYPEEFEDLPSDDVLHAINNLQHLTLLNLEWVAAESDLGLLPAHLLLMKLKVHCGLKPIILDHLTVLQRLELGVIGTPAPGSYLPQHLTNFSAEHWGMLVGELTHVDHLGIAGLQHLRQLQLVDCLQDPEQLRQLSSLQRLEHLTLGYFDHSKAVRAAPAYSKLHHLRTLWIKANDGEDVGLTQQERELFCNNLAAATSLTELGIAGNVFGTELCRHLTGLQQLQSLELTDTGAPDDRRDAYHLTSLTGLTKLVLDCIHGVDDAALTAVACWLKQLRTLHIRNCSVSSVSVLSAIATLQMLEDLSLNNCPINRLTSLEEHDIMRLTTLTCLQSLRMYDSRRNSISEAILNRFWAAVQAARQAES